MNTENTCRLCGKDVFQISCHLERVNPGEVPSAWECRPSCGARQFPDDALMGAITGDTPVEDARSWPEDNPDKETLNIIGRLLFGIGKDSCAHNFSHESLVSRAGELTGEVGKLKGLLDIRDDEIIHLHSQMAKALTDKEEAVQAASGKDLEIAQLRAKLAVSNVDRDRAIKDRDEAISQPKKTLRDMSVQYLKLRDSYHALEKERDEANAMTAKQIARETEWLQAILKAEKERDEARDMASKLISRETVELLRADKARDEAFGLASDKDGEIALLKSNLAKAVAESDAARNERDKVWAAAVSVGSANAKLLTENSALKASNAELMSGVDKALESEELAISRGKEHLAHAESAKVEAERQRDCAFDRVNTLTAVRDRLAKERDEALELKERAIRERDMLQQLLSDLKKSTDAERIQYQNQMRSFEAAPHDVKSLRTECIALQKDMVGLSDQVGRLIAQRDCMTRERGMFQDEVLTLRNQTGWRQFKDQKPTMDDSDARGCIMMCGADGRLGIIRVRDADQFDTAWWRPTMSPITLTPLGQWMQGLTPSELGRFNVNGNLSAIWESIEKFNQKQNPGDPAKPPTRPAGEGWD